MSGKIRVMLVDDHVYIRQGLRSCLAPIPEFECVAEACNGIEALAKARELSPDVILMDIHMPGMNGLEAARRLRVDVPECKVLILTVHNNREYVLQIVRSGARGYVLKDSDPEELVQAIFKVQAGGSFFCEEIAPYVHEAYTESSELTDREMQIVALLVDGKTAKEIAEQFGLRPRTVEKHKDRILARLKLHSTISLVKYALEKGIVTVDPSWQRPI